jgi:hypothetical protein
LSPPATLPNTHGLEPLDPLSGFFQTYTVTKVVGSTRTTIASDVKATDPHVGAKMDQVAYQNGYNSYATNQIANLDGGGHVWAGPRDEAEFWDQGNFRDLVRLGVANPKDTYAGFNSLDVALEIPSTQLTFDGGAPSPTPGNQNLLALWTSVAVPVTDAFGNETDVQIARGGFPHFDELFIGEQAKAQWLASTPANDLSNFGAYADRPVIVRDAQAAGDYDPGAPLAACNIQNGGPPITTRLADVVPFMNARVISPQHSPTTWGDVLRVDLGDTSAFPDGRPIGFDVIDWEYWSVFCALNPAGSPGIPDGVNANDGTNTPTTMPWAAPPWTFSTSSH